jgi:hypothetical protein
VIHASRSVGARGIVKPKTREVRLMLTNDLTKCGRLRRARHDISNCGWFAIRPLTENAQTLQLAATNSERVVGDLCRN